jgi:hypothetical protein
MSAIYLIGNQQRKLKKYDRARKKIVNKKRNKFRFEKSVVEVPWKPRGYTRLAFQRYPADQLIRRRSSTDNGKTFRYEYYYYYYYYY